MKKNVKALAFLACGVLAVGAVAVAANGNEAVTASANNAVITMIEGASIRVPDATGAAAGEDQYVNDGLRFTAKIDKATYDGWQNVDGYYLTTGTFIMPVGYYDAEEADADAFFGANAKYYWQTGTEAGAPVYNVADTTGKQEIINVLSDAYLKNETDTFYTLNGSILNLYDSSVLEGKFIGISYVAKAKTGVATEYEVATTSVTNARSVVEVAQAALIAQNDDNLTNDSPALTDPTAQAAVEADYVNKYIALSGGTAKASYTLKTYKQTSTGLQESTEVKTVDVSALPTETKLTAKDVAIENYALDTNNAGNSLNVLPRFDGKSEAVAYYNYTGNRYTLLDFEGDDPLNGGVEATNGAAGNYGIKTTNEWAAEGENSGRIGNSLWNYSYYKGVRWDNPVELPFETDTFTMDVYAPNGFDWLDGAGNGTVKEYLYLGLTGSTKTGKMNQYAEWISSSKSDSSYELAAGTYSLTFKMVDTAGAAVKFSDITEVRVSAQEGGGPILYVDNICAVNTAESTVKAFIEQNVPEFITDNKVEFTAAVKSAALFEDQITSSSLTAQYKEFGASEWTVLTAENGKYSFAATADKYQVKLTGVINGETVEEVHDVDRESAGVLLWDFESTWDYNTYTAFGYHTSASTLSTAWAKSGTTSWQLTGSISNGYIGVSMKSPFELNKTATKVGFWTNAGDYSTQFVLHIGYTGTLIKADGTRIERTSQTCEFVVSVPKGEHYNVFDLVDVNGTDERDVEVTAINWFYIGGTHGRGAVNPHKYGGLYFDDVKFF